MDDTTRYDFALDEHHCLEISHEHGRHLYYLSKLEIARLRDLLENCFD